MLKTLYHVDSYIAMSNTKENQNKIFLKKYPQNEDIDFFLQDIFHCSANNTKILDIFLTTLIFKEVIFMLQILFSNLLKQTS